MKKLLFILPVVLALFLPACGADTEFFSNATSDPWGGKEDTYKNK